MDIKIKKHLILLAIGFLMTLFIDTKLFDGFIILSQFMNYYIFPNSIITDGSYNFMMFMYFLNNLTALLGLVIFTYSLIYLLNRLRKI